MGSNNCDTCPISETCRYLKAGLGMIGKLPVFDSQGRCEWMTDPDWEYVQEARKVVPLHKS